MNWTDDKERIARRYARIEKWVSQFDKEDVAKGFASLLLQLMACRQAMRESERALDAAEDTALHGHKIVNAWAPKLRSLSDRTKRGGQTTAEARKSAAKEWQTEAIAIAKALMANGKKPHEVSAIVAKRVGKDVDSVRPALQKAGLIGKKSRKR